MCLYEQQLSDCGYKTDGEEEHYFQLIYIVGKLTANKQITKDHL